MPDNQMPNVIADDAAHPDVGRQIKRGIEARKMTVAELSRLTEIPRRSLENYLSGEQKPGFEALKKICVALDLSGDFFLFGTENDKEDAFYSMFIGTISGEITRIAMRAIEKLDRYNENEIVEIVYDGNVSDFAMKRAYLITQAIRREEEEKMLRLRLSQPEASPKSST